jgi:hypothetical protein
VGIPGRIRGWCALSAAFALACGASGCLSDDTSLPPRVDAGFPDGALPVLDASGVVDGQAPPDAAVDAALDGATLPKVDGSVSVLGLVPGGTTARSPSYVLTGTAGAAHAPVARSPNYQLVGGMSVSTQKP